MLPDGRGWLLVEFGGETKEEADAKARALMRRAREDGAAAVGDEAVRRPPTASSTSGRCARRASARRRSSRASRTRYEGWEDSAVPPERLGEYLRDSRKLARALRLRELALRPLRPGLRPRALELRPRRRATGIAKFRALPRRGGRPRASSSAARSPASTATASRAPSCCRRCSATELVERVPRVQVDLGSRLEDEPGQGRRPVPDHDEPPARHRLHPPRSTTHFAYPDDHGDFAHATTRCVGIGKCRRTDGRRRHVPELSW